MTKKTKKIKPSPMAPVVKVPRPLAHLTDDQLQLKMVRLGSLYLNSTNPREREQLKKDLAVAEAECDYRHVMQIVKG